VKNRVCALLLFICTMGYAMHSDAIGIRSHAEIAQLSVRTYHEQAAQIVPGLEQLFACEANLRAFYSGCAFPDWGYAGIHPDAAEDSHWRPFHEAYVNVLLARYAPPWTPEAQQEAAFFLGVISHSITDIPWHFSEKDHLSFLAAGLKHDGAGHGEIEMGCDFLLYGERELHPSVQTEAWFPIDTLLAVFDRQGRRKVTRDQLLAGTTRAQSMFFGGGVAGMLKAREQREKMPWVCRHLDDYYYGGLEHGAAITSVTNQYYFARLRGWHYYQNMPDYADYVRRNDDYVPLRGISEAHIIEAHPDHNTGGEPFFELGSDGPGQTRAGLIHLDLSEIPPETSIDCAMLWLYFADRRGGPQTAPKTIDAYPMNRSWYAGTQSSDPIDGANGHHADDGEVTWRHADNLLWNTPGAEGIPEDRCATPVASASFHPDDETGRWTSWDITDIVRAWINQSLANHGLLLRERESGHPPSGILRFYSSEAFMGRTDGYCGGQRVAWRPALVVFPAASPATAPL
jgi:hypothetical protein